MSGSVTPLSTQDRKPDEDEAAKHDAGGEAGLATVEEPAIAAPGLEREVPLSHAGLAAGFHPVERDQGGQWRWTDGDADLAALLPLLPAGGARLTLHLRGAARAWLEPARQRHAALS